MAIFTELKINIPYFIIVFLICTQHSSAHSGILDDMSKSIENTEIQSHRDNENRWREWCRNGKLLSCGLYHSERGQRYPNIEKNYGKDFTRYISQYYGCAATADGHLGGDHNTSPTARKMAIELGHELVRLGAETVARICEPCSATASMPEEVKKACLSPCDRMAQERPSPEEIASYFPQSCNEALAKYGDLASVSTQELLGENFDEVVNPGKKMHEKGCRRQGESYQQTVETARRQFEQRCTAEMRTPHVSPQGPNLASGPSKNPSSPQHKQPGQGGEFDCDKLLGRNDYAAFSGAENDFIATSCCPADRSGTPHDRRREDYANRENKWTSQCVLDRLCRFNPSIVRSLVNDEYEIETYVTVSGMPNIIILNATIFRTRGTNEIVEYFDGARWRTRLTPRGGFTDQYRATIEIDDYLDCDRAAASFVHEYTHLRSRLTDRREQEIEATLAEDSISQFLENGSRQLSRRAQQCIRYTWEVGETDYAFSPRPGWRVVNRNRDRNETHWQNETTGEIEVRDSVPGDIWQADTPNMQEELVDISGWICP